MILLHMYQNPASQIAAAGGDPSQLDPKKVQEEFDDFYEEVYDELAKFGEIEELNVCENLGDHMVGNVYVKFADEEATDDALKGLFGRFYAGRPLVCEFSPVTDFREARCRQYDEAVCTRGGYCNFMHIRTPSRSLKRDLDRKWAKKWKKDKKDDEEDDDGGENGQEPPPPAEKEPENDPPPEPQQNGYPPQEDRDRYDDRGYDRDRRRDHRDRSPPRRRDDYEPRYRSRDYDRGGRDDYDRRRDRYYDDRRRDYDDRDRDRPPRA